jgi:hypothetical protein
MLFFFHITSPTYACLALNRGATLLMTYTRPFRRTTLQAGCLDFNELNDAAIFITKSPLCQMARAMSIILIKYYRPRKINGVGVCIGACYKKGCTIGLSAASTFISCSNHVEMRNGNTDFRENL